MPDRGARILIVDDSPANLLALESTLESLGHAIVRASSGEEALKSLLKDDFAVVLMDVVMPGFDGLQTAALMKKREKSRRTPIIFLSAFSNAPREILEGYEHGAVDYLVKPFDPNVLRAKVSVFVDLYLKAQEIARQATLLVTEQNARKLAEANERALRSLSENIPQQIWTATPDGALDFVNAVTVKYFGGSAEDVLGGGWQAMVHPDDLPSAVVRWTHSLGSGDEYVVEFRLRRADGEYRWHLGRALPQRDTEQGPSHGKIARWIGTNTDVHDRRLLTERQLELELRDRQVRHMALRADVSAALSAGDLGKMLSSVAAAVLQHLAVSTVEVWTVDAMGQSLELGAQAGAVRHAPDARVALGAGDVGRIAGSQAPVLEGGFAGYPLVLAERSVGVVAVYGAVELAPDMLEAVASVADTLAQGIERKRAEDALALHVRELARSNAELERFAYVASHDLQEPLRMVGSYTQLLGRRYQGKLDSDADEFIAFAVDGVERMRALINDLLAFSRVGTRSAEMAPVALAVPLAEAMANLQIALKESAAEVVVAELPTVTADVRQLVQLFQNLMGNALKFSGDGKPRIEVGAERIGDEWRISVRDHGIGIDPAFFDRLFVVFQRLHNRSQYAGNGIGLAICKKIIERHGGRIWVESSLGDGATFYFTLRA